MEHDVEQKNKSFADTATPTATTPPLVTVPTYQSKPKSNNSSSIILQWLTYDFWGLTILAASVLAVTVISHYIAHTNDESFTPYAIAAVLVLLPISVVCDYIYSKQEPDKKTDIASVIMIIHAVVFALFCIGTLVAIVISLVQLAIGGSDATGTLVAIYSEIVVVFLYAAIFLRTLHSVRPMWLRKIFSLIMVVVIGTILGLSIIGPLSGAILTRDDNLIDNNLGIVQQGIDNYVNSQNKLPTSLSDVTLIGDARTIVRRNLVNYMPDSKPTTITQSTFNPNTSMKTYYYKLCVNYKAVANSGETPADGYSSLLSTKSHPAGSYCYKVSSSPTYLDNL